MAKAKKVRSYREGIDPGLQGTRKWLEQWYGDSSDLLISEISLTCPNVQDVMTPVQRKSYKQAFQRNETPLHSYLKFAAWEWLNSRKNKGIKPDYEVQMYFPFEDLLEGVTFTGSTFDPSVAQLIAKGRQDVFADFGSIIFADVLCGRCSVEIGFTQPLNLCMPLLEDLVDKSIWIPFPKGIEPRQFDPLTYNLVKVAAYEIELLGS